MKNNTVCYIYLYYYLQVHIQVFKVHIFSFIEYKSSKTFTATVIKYCTTQHLSSLVSINNINAAFFFSHTKTKSTSTLKTDVFIGNNTNGCPCWSTSQVQSKIQIHLVHMKLLNKPLYYIIHVDWNSLTFLMSVQTLVEAICFMLEIKLMSWRNS